MLIASKTVDGVGPTPASRLRQRRPGRQRAQRESPAGTSLDQLLAIDLLQLTLPLRESLHCFCNTCQPVIEVTASYSRLGEEVEIAWVAKQEHGPGARARVGLPVAERAADRALILNRGGDRPAFGRGVTHRARDEDALLASHSRMRSGCARRAAAVRSTITPKRYALACVIGERGLRGIRTMSRGFETFSSPPLPRVHRGYEVLTAFPQSAKRSRGEGFGDEPGAGS